MNGATPSALLRRGGARRHHRADRHRQGRRPAPGEGGARNWRCRWPTMPRCRSRDRRTARETTTGRSRASTSCAKSRRPPHRFFVNDLSGPLYILNRTTKNADDLPRLQRQRHVMRGLFDELATRERARQRLHQLRVRSRLRQQRPLLHHPPRGARAPGRSCAGQRGRSRPAGQRLHADAADSDAGERRSRRRADRVDGLEHLQCDVRRHRAGAAARAAQQPNPPDGRSDLQSGRPSRRSGLAGALRGLRRRRIGRSADRAFASTRSASTRSSERSCGSFRTSPNTPTRAR